MIDTIDISASNPHKKIYVTYPYTYDRVTLLNSGLTSSLRLLRSGDSFFEGITNFTNEDDRGRSFTNWRCIKKYKPKTGKADIYFNANLLITPNLNKLSDYLNKLGKISPREISLSLKRKADLFFPPILINLWVDEYEELITEKETLNHLNKIYNKNYDLNLDKKIWKVLTNSKAFQILSKEETWKENIDQVLNTLKKLSLEKENVRKQIEVSLNTLKELSNFQKIQHEARVTQLDEIRTRHETLNIEQDLKVNELFMKAIESPDVSCLTFGMTFLSNFLPSSSN